MWKYAKVGKIMKQGEKVCKKNCEENNLLYILHTGDHWTFQVVCKVLGILSQKSQWFGKIIKTI